MSYDVLKPLASGGLVIAPDKATQLKQCLIRIVSQQRIRIVQRTGWHEEAQFVLPTESIGNDGNREVSIYYGPDTSAAYSVSGTVEDWKREIAPLIDGNHRLMFAIAVAVAGVVADLLKEESLAFNYVGMSSSGKSTALRVAASVWGGKPYVKQWRATANGLEGLAKAHSGTCLVLDELGQLDDKNASDAAYQLMNGMGKSRARVDGSTKQAARWTLALLSSGETTLSEKIKAAGKRSKAGQAVRVIDIPADAGQGMGLFDDTKSIAPATFSDLLTERSATIFGTLGPAFVQSIARAPQDSIRQLRNAIDHIGAVLLGGIPKPEGQVSRSARRFAIVAAAGELLNDVLGQPWRQGAMREAAHKCFLAALGRGGGTTSAEYTAIIDAVREIVEKYGVSPRFHDFTDNPFSQGSSVLNDKPKSFHHGGFLGYHGFHDGEEVWAFTETGFREIVNEIVEPRMAAQILAEKGASVFHASDGRYRWTKKIGGGTKKLYALKATALEID
jgi:putative DNA primase/helicase